LMVQPLAQAGAYKLPLGGDYLAFREVGAGQHGAYKGIESIAVFFRENVPPGAALFHEELDWHFSYYLFGVPVEVISNRSQPIDPALVARTVARTESYVVFSDWQEASYKRLQAGLLPYGLQLEEAMQAYPPGTDRLSFVVYRIIKS
jgi:hypothetical protein